MKFLRQIHCVQPKNAEYFAGSPDFLRVNQTEAPFGRSAVRAKKVLISVISFYRLRISPLSPPTCRFIPTCSQYALEAVEKYGAAKGGWLAIKRISKCHPFHLTEHDYYDPVP